MISLAIDTSSPVGSVSVARSNTVLAGGRFGEHESHMREIGKTVDRTLSRAGFALDDVQRIALVSGPGSFTGLRIGMAFVKGLHAASGIPVVTINALELLALPLIQDHTLAISMIDARKDQVYAALYRRSRPGKSGSGAEPVLEPVVASPDTFLSKIVCLHEFTEDCETLICAGSGTARYLREITEILGSRVLCAPDKMHSPSTDLLAVRAPDMTPVSEEMLLALEPFYIRSSDAQLKRLREMKTDG